MKIHPLTGKPYKTHAEWAIHESDVNILVGRFGWSRKARDGSPKFHAGVDYRAKPGAFVYAPHEGEIVRAGFQTNRHGDQKNEGYGSRLYLRLHGEVETRYAHLLWQVYRVGMKVHRGAILGVTGETGNVLSGRPGPPHLHWEVRLWNGTAYHPVNPLWWLYGDDYASRDGIPDPRDTLET